MSYHWRRKNPVRHSVPEIDLLVEDLLAEHGIVRPFDMWELASALGLLTAVAPIERATISERRVLVSSTAIAERQQGLLGHEIGHYLCRELDIPDTESNADALGARLLVPTHTLAIDLPDTGLDLPALRVLYPNASATLLARRVAATLGGRVSSWLCARLYAMHGNGGDVPRAMVRRIAKQAWKQQEVQGFGDGFLERMARAWPIGGGWSIAIDNVPDPRSLTAPIETIGACT